MQYQSITPTGHVQIRCHRCRQRLGDIVSFYGRAAVFCYRCKGLTVLRGEGVDVEVSELVTKRNDRRHLSLKPSDGCPSCDRYPVFAALFVGQLQRICRVCKTGYVVARSDSRAAIDAVLASHPNLVLSAGSGQIPVMGVTAYPSSEEMLERMEERWATFSKAKLREKGTVAVGLRFAVFTRDGFRCRYCGRSIDDGVILHADHVIPESKGGPTTLENLVTACIDCNLGKSDKDLPREVVPMIKGIDTISGPMRN